MMMTLKRFSALIALAGAPTATAEDIERAVRADATRRHERGRSKLARRLVRKVALGRAGAF